MKKEEFRFRSTNDAVDIRAVRYIPEGEIKAVLQIAHGMAEFIDRYERNRFSHVNRKGNEAFITTNMRVLAENKWLDDIEFIKAFTIFFACADSFASSIYIFRILLLFKFRSKI